MKKLFRSSLLLLLAILLFAASANASALDVGKWDSGTREQIQKMIDANGTSSPGYDAGKKPYAVFDWDQTCIFNDTEESLFRWMIEHVAFKAAPERFAAAIRNGIPSDNFSDSYNNADGKPVNIDLIAADLDSDYKFLYENYIADGKKTLEEIRATEEFIDFRGKLAYLYEAIGGTFSADVSYPWVLYLFAGMTESEVREVSELANDAALHDSLDTYSLTSSASLPGQAGVISYGGYKKGLRLVPEMSNLMNVLRENGFDVYICSASHETVVRVFAGLPKYGYNVPPENIIAMRTKMENGVYLGEYDYSNDYPQTQQKGKTTAIQQTLVSKYGYGPVFVAGDSQGDFNMSTEFPDTQLTLVINRLRSDDFGKLGPKAIEQLGGERARFVLQGRDENTGQFRPSMSTIKMGADKEALLHSSLVN
jgi:phosphoserine phosphatase